MTFDRVWGGVPSKFEKTSRTEMSMSGRLRITFAALKMEDSWSSEDHDHIPRPVEERIRDLSLSRSRTRSGLVLVPTMISRPSRDLPSDPD
jgi:hypothetical protein